ncbi:MAG: hypothetical protein QNJ12_02655 [Ilumatobacter sp.]|uniref:hypothetical protein n=1 Tax=Ilumatobacter sp. TaxID=1967498 RepID=UPI00260C6A08|nr:hypothetical protein [Ilumatobacter sp.]MDJ0767659.1 hypothetical protein [Ilumatobacter sp.]
MELTSIEPERFRGDGEPVGSAADPTGAPGLVPSGRERWRLMSAVVLVGVVALLLGWVVGRASRSDGESVGGQPGATAPDDSAAAAATSTTLAGERLPAPPSTARRQTEDRPVPTTTTIPPPESNPVTVDPRLAGLPIRLVGVTTGSRLVDVDLRTQTMVTHAPGNLPRTGMFENRLAVGDDWIALAQPDRGEMYVIRDNGARSVVDIGDGWELHWVDGTDTFWWMVFEEPAGPERFVEYTIDGAPTGSVFEMNGLWPDGADPLGGLVVGRAGKAYVVSGGDVTFLASGDLVALSASTGVFYDCDEQMECGLTVLDRATGAIGGVPSSDDVDLGELHGFGWGGPSASLSPDGRYLAALLFGQQADGLVLVDLSTGDVRRLIEEPMGWAIAWSHDSRLAFFIDGDGRPVAHDVATDDTFPVADGLSSWIELAVRPIGDA